MNKPILVVLFLFVMLQCLSSQNLVHNPSFEELRNLPVKRLEVWNYEFESTSSHKAFREHLNYWFSGNKNSPDLRILKEAYFAYSKSKYGKHYRARTGSNVIGLVTYMENKAGNNFREYIAIKLKESLKEGIKTYVEFWVLLDRQSKYASNNLGCYFSKKKIYSPAETPILLTPQINADSIILGDRFEWKKISGTFLPKDAYNFLTIGNFYSHENTKLEEITFFRGEPFIDPTAYYLIDDVRVWQEGTLPEKKFKAENIEVGTIIELENIEFETNSADLKESSFLELNELLALMKSNSTLKIEIQGHTDNVGNDSANQLLSEKRAKRIYNYLLSKSINPAHLNYRGFGKSKPIADNSTTEGRSRNRRVEFLVLDKSH